MDPITWNDFEKVDIRVGKIIEILDFPEALKQGMTGHGSTSKRPAKEALQNAGVL